MDIFIRDLSGNEFTVVAQTEHEIELNGNQVLKLTITPTGVNNEFIDDVDNLWELDYGLDTYTIVYVRKITRGSGYYLDVRAIHKALDYLDSVRLYSRFDGYLSATKAFNDLFNTTPYSVIILDDFDGIDIEGYGDGDSKLESFKRLLERFKAEFYISGSTFYISKYIGRDTQFEYRHKLNASNIQLEVDGAEMWTYVRGFGDYDESEENIYANAKIKLTYESPLAKIVGKRHAPRVAKGSYKLESTIMKEMREVVDNSALLSVSADIQDLRKQGYPYAQPEVGDRVFVVDERINFNQEVRVVKVVTERYANTEIRRVTITFGTERLGRRYASNLSSTMNRLNDILKGNATFERSVLDVRAQDMLKKLKSVDTELTLDNGIYAIDKNNPNNVLGLNSAGWFISTDGGQTSKVIATAEGIHADAITVGTLVAQRMHAIDKNTTVSIEQGAMTIDRIGGYTMKIGADGLLMLNNDGTERFKAGPVFVNSSALGTINSNVYLAAAVGNEVRAVDISQVPSDGAWESYNYVDIRARGLIADIIRPNFTTHLYLGTDNEVRVTSKGGGTSGEVAYRKLRTAGVYGTYFDLNSSIGDNTNVYVRPSSNGEVRFTAIDTLENYVNVRAEQALLTAVVAKGTNTHLYMGTDNELRVTGKGLASGTIAYKQVRSAGYFGNSLDINTGTNLYIRPSSGGEVRVTNTGTTGTYASVRADKFIGQLVESSAEELKTNIEKWDLNASQVIRDTVLYEYNYKYDLEQGVDTRRHGVVIGRETPEHIINGKGISVYELTSTLAKALQETIERLDELEKKEIIEHERDNE